ncbi:non-hydrolyzing UDP-N-acetylglucosamine 2-epimerase [Nonlabens sp.]|uniref:non-hydrolyzing UDP-N-acetylglucosamine 2-epimerase n=1 Tax=Nonlabens sp. TaxID=1888209 RepID=UPI003F6A1E73
MIFVIFGTRPEFIKLAPVIHELINKGVNHKVVNTGQHKEMLLPLLDWFDITPDYNLSIMKPNQGLNGIIHSSIDLLDNLYESENPNIVITQGDTTTAFVASLAAFNRKIQVAHVEAGLRTDDLYNPFPEEANRRLISQIAQFHFTPTATNTSNLLKCGIQNEVVFETGNTVIDALLYTKNKLRGQSHLPNSLINVISKYGRLITITGHRRENIGKGFDEIFNAIKELASMNTNILFVYPVHLNPLVKNEAERILNGLNNVLLVMPMDYPAFVELMSKSYLIISDSGGVQEEAPSLNVPVLVTRTNTERMEVVKAGAVVLVGTKKQDIINKAMLLIDDKEIYESMVAAKNPYGKGDASKKIISILKEYV